MDDAISRSATAAFLDGMGAKYLASVIEDPKRCPSVNTSDRKAGKWINDRGLYYCSECNMMWSHWWANVVPPERMYEELRFCPKCGAPMRD